MEQEGVDTKYGAITVIQQTEIFWKLESGIKTYQRSPAGFDLVVGVEEDVQQRPGAAPHEHHQRPHHRHREHAVQDVQRCLSAAL